MQTKKLWMLALCSGLAMAGCKTTGTDLGGMIGAGTSMATAASLSDEDAAAMGKRTAEAMDKEYKVASSNSKYGKRVAALTDGAVRRRPHSSDTKKQSSSNRVRA